MPPTIVQLRGTTMAVARVGESQDQSTELIWVHGWGQSGAAFMELAQGMAREHASLVLDLPGFGNASLPPQTWGTGDYADSIAEWIKSLPPRRRVWIAHSFGCRVGIRLAASHPGVLDGMVLIAAAGLRRKRTLLQTIKLKTRIYAFKIAKLFVPAGPARERLYSRFGSTDARNAGLMRTVFLRTVNEDLADVAPAVTCRTLLLYGRDDNDTPPEMGERLQKLIPQAELHVLNGFDHLSILGAGRHQVSSEIRRFLRPAS